jgi:hypothetical protein
MAMPTYVGHINSQISSSTTRAYPGGHALDDVAFFFGHGQNGSCYCAPTDLTPWTEITGLALNTDGTDSAVDRIVKVWWMRLPGSGLANLGVTRVGTGNAYVTMPIIRGLPTTGLPYSKYASSVVNSASTAISFPTLTTNTVDNFIINFHCNSISNGTAQFGSFANANLANVSTRLAVGTVQYNQVGLATGEKAVAGSIGVGTAVLANAAKQINIVIAAGVPGSDSTYPYRAIISRRRR